MTVNVILFSIISNPLNFYDVTFDIMIVMCDSSRKIHKK